MEFGFLLVNAFTDLVGETNPDTVDTDRKMVVAAINFMIDSFFVGCVMFGVELVENF